MCRFTMNAQANGGAVTAPGCMWRRATRLGWASTRCAKRKVHKFIARRHDTGGSGVACHRQAIRLSNGCLPVWRAICKRPGLRAQAAGFRGVSMQPLWKSVFQRNRLMTRTLPEPPQRQPAHGGGGVDEQQDAVITGGAMRESDGVFIWKAETHR